MNEKNSLPTTIKSKKLIRYISSLSLEMAEIIGLQKTLWLSRKLGGMIFYISNRENSESFLSISREIGKEEAKKLCHYFKGTWVYIPKNEIFFKKVREKNLLEMLKKGLLEPQTIRSLALKANITNPQLLFGERVKNKVKDERLIKVRG